MAQGPLCPQGIEINRKLNTTGFPVGNTHSVLFSNNIDALTGNPE